MKYVKFAHGMAIEITNYTVMCCSKMKSEVGGVWKEKIQNGEKKGEKCVAHVEGKMIEIIFLTQAEMHPKVWGCFLL